LKVALVHDWLTGMRGGEKVLLQFCRLFPGAPIYTLVHKPGSVDRAIESHPIRTSWMNAVPGISRFYRHALPLMPLTVERFDLSEFDVVISLSHCVAKGVITRPDALHLCYCFTPMRYAWQPPSEYAGMGPVARTGLSIMRPYLRAWDFRSAGHVHGFWSNSHTTAGRIARFYGRKARVLYSPIDTQFFTPSHVPREDFLLAVGALAPYKKVEHAVLAAQSLGRRLVVIGSGQGMAGLRKIVTDTTTLLGWQPDEVIRDHYRRASALLMPQEEDFGMVPLEAMACGCPVIAFGAGGALETVGDGASLHESAGASTSAGNWLAPGGVLYGTQSVSALADAIRRFDTLSDKIPAGALVARASQFSEIAFADQVARDLALFGLRPASATSEPTSGQKAQPTHARRSAVG
jgi:glycosyltransferase involved in cell wall biosynthesis